MDGSNGIWVLLSRYLYIVFVQQCATEVPLIRVSTLNTSLNHEGSAFSLWYRLSYSVGSRCIFSSSPGHFAAIVANQPTDCWTSGNRSTFPSLKKCGDKANDDDAALHRRLPACASQAMRSPPVENFSGISFPATSVSSPNLAPFYMRFQLGIPPAYILRRGDRL